MNTSLNMARVRHMMSIVSASRRDYESHRNPQHGAIIKNEEKFNALFANDACELAHLEHNGFIRRVPGHIYIIIA